MRIRCRDLKIEFVPGYGFVLSCRVDGEYNDVAKSWADKLKEKFISLEIKAWYESRSLDANSYFHVLCNKLAHKMQTSLDEVKDEMVVKYGTIARSSDGMYAGAKLPVAVDVKQFYRYARWIGESEDEGVRYNHYLLMKQTHTLDSAEFSKLLDGLISECKALGVETIPPRELERMIGRWQSTE